MFPLRLEILSSAGVSLRNSILDLVEDFDSKGDLLLFFVAIQQEKSFDLKIISGKHF